jgi:hypothetical protein
VLKVFKFFCTKPKTKSTHDYPEQSPCSKPTSWFEKKDIPEWLLATNSNTKPFLDAGTMAREFKAPPLCRVVSMAAKNALQVISELVRLQVFFFFKSAYS